MDRTVILLFGGESNERLVSVASAQNMAIAINPTILWFWAVDGTIFELDFAELLHHKNPFTEELIPSKKPKYSSINEAIIAAKVLNGLFVLGLHGGMGEDGRLQTMLEEAHIPYTGSDAKTSRIAFDKALTKYHAKNAGLAVTPHRVVNVNAQEHGLSDILACLKEWGPVIMKPCRGGSSLGLKKITSNDDIKPALEELSAHPNDDYLLEKLLIGQEYTVGVIDQGDNGICALPVTEIVIEKDKDFDYAGKYLGQGTKEITPANIDDGLATALKKNALLAHTALKLFGYSRSDFIVANNEIYFLEINTLPGLTKSSLIPQQLHEQGIEISDFLACQIALAKKRLALTDTVIADR